LRAKREENTLYMLKILNDVVNVIFILNMMEIDVHVVIIHLETKEDLLLQINSH
jgi:hypothetical protein